MLAALCHGSEVAEKLGGKGWTILCDEVGTTGLCSSYHGNTMGSEPYDKLPVFTETRIRFGGRHAPSPGGETGKYFDEGVLAYKIEDDTLKLAVAAGTDPNQWPKYGNLLYGQVDLFLDVLHEGRVAHHALLNATNRDRPLGHSGYWDAARAFRTGGGASVGELVLLEDENHGQPSGGSPEGDRRNHSAGLLGVASGVAHRPPRARFVSPTLSHEP